MGPDYSAPPADDRTRDEKDMPDGIVNLEALRNLWQARDDRYAARKFDPKPSEIDAVRAYRISETRDLPVQQRAAGYREAMSWVPPQVIR